MQGLMQDVPLNIPSLIHHAAKLHPRKTVTTKTADGKKTATFAQVIERSRKLAAALRGLGVKDHERVATLCWNHQEHLEAYIAAPCMGAVLHTLNLRLFPDDISLHRPARRRPRAHHRQVPVALVGEGGAQGHLRPRHHRGRRRAAARRFRARTTTRN